MTVTIKGRIFSLSFDAAEDAAPAWTWTGKIPLCPRHLEQWAKAVPLLPHGREDSKLAPVTVVSPDVQVVSCPSCDWHSEPLK